MAAKLDVVNGVLAALGQEPVLDLGSASLGQSVAALKITRVIDQVRDVVLRRHGWTCALTYVTLQPAQIPGYANWKYPYVYLLPGDALRTWEIEGCLFGPTGWGSPTCAAPAVPLTPMPGPGWSPDAYGGAYASAPGCWPYPSFGQRWEAGTYDTNIGARQVIRSVDGAMLNVAYVRAPSWPAIDAHVADAIIAELAVRTCKSVTGDAPGQDLRSDAASRLSIAVGVDGSQADSETRGPSHLAIVRHIGA